MKILNPLIKTAVIILVIVISIVFFRAYDSRNMPKLKVWHIQKPTPELLLNNDYRSFEEYANADQQYVRSNIDAVVSSDFDIFERYNPSSNNYPYKSNMDYNSSFVLDPGQKAKAVVVLIHGLSDSPYHMRDIAKSLFEKDYYVFVLRMPGHGTLPSGLLDVKWQDWQKAVSWSMKTADELSILRGDIPVYMGGFSTGGSLSFNYSFNAIDNDKLRMPDKVFLFSPAAGVSSLAYVGSWHHSLSWLPYFKKFAWLDILPEYDPAKYMSFTKNAGRQVFLLCKENMKLAKEINKKNDQNKLPAFISFESWVDATVIPKDLVTLYNLIGDSNDELLLFDVNRKFAPFIKGNVSEELEAIVRENSSNYKFEFLSNLPIDSMDNLLGIFTFNSNGDKIEIESENYNRWPNSIYSISHISIPISHANELYGKNSALSNMLFVGEKNSLIVPSSDITRIRYNPFFDFMMKQIGEFIEDNDNGGNK